MGWDMSITKNYYISDLFFNKSHNCTLSGPDRKDTAGDLSLIVYRKTYKYWNL